MTRIVEVQDSAPHLHAEKACQLEKKRLPWAPMPHSARHHPLLHWMLTFEHLPRRRRGDAGVGDGAAGDVGMTRIGEVQDSALHLHAEKACQLEKKRLPWAPMPLSTRHHPLLHWMLTFEHLPSRRRRWCW